MSTIKPRPSGHLTRHAFPVLAVAATAATLTIAPSIAWADGGDNHRTTGTFTLAFAKCMRAHGVANFPDPNGHGGQLGPNSGVGLGTPNFQKAVNGPCRKLAPYEWVASGPVKR